MPRTSTLLVLLAVGAASGPAQAQEMSVPEGPRTAPLAVSDDLRRIEPVEEIPTLRDLELPEGFDLVRFYPEGQPLPAGDVNGDGQTDLVYTAPVVADARTEALGDLTAQTVLYFGPGLDPVPSQVVFAHLRPVGDVDGDGLADAYSVPAGGGPIRLFRGTPGGYEDAGDVLAGGTALTGLGDSRRTAGFADFDGDGLADLASIATPDKLAVLFGRGAYVEVDLDSGFRRELLTVADLDGDGRDEALFTLRSGVQTETALVQIRFPDGTEPESSVVFVTSAPIGLFGPVFALDVDGDGDEDILDVSAETRAFLQTSGGTFPAAPLLSRTQAFPVGDLDGDGFEDFYLRAQNLNLVSYGPALPLGPNDIVFRNDISVPLPPSASGLVPRVGDVRLPPQYGDLDGDGFDEFVLAVSLAEPSGRGRPALHALGFGRLLVGGDDRQPEAAPLYYASDAARPFGGSSVPATVGLGDVNGDGVDDLGLVHEPAGFDGDPRIEVFYGGDALADGPDLTLRARDALFFSEVTRSTNPARQPFGVAAGDFNDDGANDVAAVYPNLNLSLDGDASGLYAGGAVIWLGGPDADGEPDWVLRCNTTEGTRQSCVPRTPSSRSSGYSAVDVGDVNGDGVDDLVLVGAGADLAVLLGHSGPLPGPDDPLPVDRADTRTVGQDAAWKRLEHPGDLDGDGYGDTVVCDVVVPSGGACRVVRGAAEGFATGDPVALDPSPGSYPGFALTHGDVDGDGLPDVVAANAFGVSAPPLLDVYLGGAIGGGPDVTSDIVGTFVAPGGGGRIFFGEVTALPDLDGDGDQEILLAWEFGVPALDALVVAGGTFEPLARLAAPNPSRGLGAMNGFINREVHAAVGDFDGDGTPDVVLTQENDGNAAPEASRVYRYALSGFTVGTGPPPPPAVTVEVGPNPARSRFTVRAGAPSGFEVEVYDAVGRRVAQASAEAGAGAVQVDASGLAPGLYLVRVRSGDHVATRTVTVVR